MWFILSVQGKRFLKTDLKRQAKNERTPGNGWGWPPCKSLNPAPHLKGCYLMSTSNYLANEHNKMSTRNVFHL